MAVTLALGKVTITMKTNDEEEATMSFPRYEVLETEIAPMIRRASIYDVLISLNEGEDFDSICVIHNLNIVETRIALEYIEKHREKLEAELPGLLKIKAERRAHYEALAADIQKKIDKLPMTPKRQAFYALKEKNRHT